MNSQQFVQQLREIVGAANLQEGPVVAETLPAWWEVAPLLSINPGTPEEVAAVVRTAEEAGVAVLPAGGATRIQTGYPPGADKPYLLVQTQRMNRILDHQPDDLTVTCEPGVTLATLQQTLATRKQFLALDVPLPEAATLGGIVSTNASGFWRPAYGAPRDLLIGMHAVITGGETIKGGGRVVKNVAGYDVCKLFTGAWGTMGVLTELTFRIRALPQTEHALCWAAPTLAEAAQLGLRLHHARLALTFVLATSEWNGAPCLIVGAHGTAERVPWQLEEADRLLKEAGWTSASVAVPPSELEALRNRQARGGAAPQLAGEIACLPTEQAEFIAHLEQLPGLALTAHCASGILSFAFAATGASLPAQVQRLLPKSANLLWIRLEGQHEETLPLWGEKREDFALHRALKQSLDPKRTFSPGRFYNRL